MKKKMTENYEQLSFDGNKCKQFVPGDRVSSAIAGEIAKPA